MCAVPVDACGMFSGTVLPGSMGHFAAQQVDEAALSAVEITPVIHHSKVLKATECYY